jgi:hypothetical protein
MNALTETGAIETARRKVIEALSARFEIDPERVLFLDAEKPDKPWLSAEVLISIARQSGKFQEIEEGFDQYIPAPLNQVVHYGRVVDESGKVWRRSGVATVGEMPGNLYRGGRNPDGHQLAAARALGAALDGAGFNPLKAGAVVSGRGSVVGGQEKRGRIEFAAQGDPKRAQRVMDGEADGTVEFRVLTPDRAVGVDEAATKNNDLKQIHAMAEEVGLIAKRVGVPKDYSEYRRWMLENWGVKSSAGMDATERASVIEALRVLIRKQEALDL